MPELPEIETIRRDLQIELRGERLASIEVSDRRLMTAQEERHWKEATLGRTWAGFERHGKYLIVVLDDKSRLVFHLRMTGQLVVSAGESKAKRRLRLRFAGGKTLDLIDQRRFAEVWFRAPQEPLRTTTPLGPDALTGLNRDLFLHILKRRTTRIQPLLMDQRLIAGVGNIYAQEALFKALIRPSRPGRRITREEGGRLFEALQETLRQAIDHRGSTSRNYRDGYGKEGSAQTLHAVYRRGGKPCPRCSTPLKAGRIGGRGTVYCPQCQR